MKFLNKTIEWGLYLFIFLLPWQTRLILKEGNLNGYWEYGTVSVYGTEILLCFIFILAIVHLFTNRLQISSEADPSLTENQRTVFKISKIEIAVIIFLMFALFSIFWAESRSVALMAGLRLAEGIGLFLVLRMFNFDWKKINWAFIFSAFAQAILGIYQFLTQTTFASKWLGMAIHDPATLGTIVVEASGGRWLRAYGSLPHPNMLGVFLAVGIFLTIILYQKASVLREKIFLVSIFSILTFGLFTTFSKSAILATAIILLTFWISSFIFQPAKENKTILSKLICLFTFVAIIFSIIFWEPVSTRIMGNRRLEVKSTNERLGYFGESWELMKEHPFFGVGLGNYTLALYNKINPNLNSWEYQPVHNIYLLILTELGAFGFFIFLSILFFFFWSLQKNSTWYNLFNLRNAVFPLVLIIGLFDHYLWTLYFGIILFWFCFGFWFLGGKYKFNYNNLT